MTLIWGILALVGMGIGVLFFGILFERAVKWGGRKWKARRNRCCFRRITRRGYKIEALPIRGKRWEDEL